MDNIHKGGEEPEKLPEDPKKIREILAERVKIFLAKIALKLNR